MSSVGGILVHTHARAVDQAETRVPGPVNPHDRVQEVGVDGGDHDPPERPLRIANAPADGNPGLGGRPAHVEVAHGPRPPREDVPDIGPVGDIRAHEVADALTRRRDRAARVDPVDAAHGRVVGPKLVEEAIPFPFRRG